MKMRSSTKLIVYTAAAIMITTALLIWKIGPNGESPYIGERTPAADSSSH